MVAAVAQRRAAGDWRGACAAARMDVAVDLGATANHHGRRVADAVRDDLLHLAPDLVRWHLPRRGTGGTGMLQPNVRIALKYYRVDKAVLTLRVATPPDLYNAQRLRLELADNPKGTRPFQHWADTRFRWDVRRAGDLLRHLGGGDRTPFFHRDGRPLRADELPATAPDESDPVARTEWIMMLQDSGRLVEAWAAAGAEADLTIPPASGAGPYRVRLAGQMSPALTTLLPLLRERAARTGPITAILSRDGRTYGEPRLQVTCVDGEPPRAVVVPRVPGSYAHIPEFRWRRPPDVDLLRFGRIAPRELHPLVRAAMFPDEPTAGRYAPPAPAVPKDVRVRCGGEWHRVGFGPDGIAALSHTDEEIRRERALLALSGPPSRCLAVVRDWRNRDGWLPRRLRDLRTHLNRAVLHGDADEVERLLDAGLDPVGLRSRRNGRTLLHRVTHLDRPELVRRLVDAGLDIDERDAEGDTPLEVALYSGARPPIIRALLDAGAVPSGHILNYVGERYENQELIRGWLRAARQPGTQERGR
jgi:hypothetical protein